MSFYYLDSSAIVKRYVPEVGSNWVVQLCEARDSETGEFLHTLLIGELTLIEVVAAIIKRVEKTHELSKQEGEGASALFFNHTQTQYEIAPWAPGLIERTVKLVKKHALRAYDAVQLALAVRANDLFQANGLALIFVSSDKTLLQAAQNEGLTTDNPQDHP